MKKVISLLLTAVMLMSSVVAIAAPTVDYVFYAENEAGYYVYGSYAKDIVKDLTVTPTDAGIYANGTKYSYAKDGNTANLNASNEMEAPKFGIKLEAPKSYFEKLEVKPYTVKAYGETVGSPEVYDFDTNELVEKSNNANLSNVTIKRVLKANTQFVMDPEFSPNHTKYTIYGRFADANSTLSNVTISGIVEHSGATLSFEKTATGNVPAEGTDTTIIRVTAEDKTTTKDYEFKFVNSLDLAANGTKKISPVNGADFWYNANNLDKLQTISSTQTLTCYPQKNDRERKRSLLTFNITPGMANAKAVGLSLSAMYYNQADSDCYKNVKINAYPVSLAKDYKYDEETITYNNSIGAGKMEVGANPVGELVIDKFTDRSYYTYSINVTDYVKECARNGETQCTFMLEIGGFDLLKTTTLNNIQFTHYAYDTGSTNYITQLVWE